MYRPFPALLLSALCFLPSCAQKSLQSPDHTVELDRVTALLDDYRGETQSLEEARIGLDAILAQSPDYAPAHREYARYQIMAGHISYRNFVPGSLEAAEASLNRALELDPNYAAAYVLAGHLYTLQRNFPRANESLDKAQALGSTDPWLYLNRADVLDRQGNMDVALPLYRKVLDSGTTNLKALEAAHSGVIGYYRAYHRDGEADQAYRDLIAFAPDVAWNYGSYANFLLCRMDQAGPAIEQFRLALSKMKYGVAITGLAAALYRDWAFQLMEGEPAQAAATLAEAESLRPGDPVSIYQANCRDEGRGIESIKLAVRVAEIRNKAEVVP